MSPFVDGPGSRDRHCSNERRAGDGRVCLGIRVGHFHRAGPVVVAVVPRPLTRQSQDGLRALLLAAGLTHACVGTTPARPPERTPAMSFVPFSPGRTEPARRANLDAVAP